MPPSQGCVSGENRAWQVAKIQNLLGVLRNIVISGLCFLSPLIFEGSGGLSFPSHLALPLPHAQRRESHSQLSLGIELAQAGGLHTSPLTLVPGALLSSLQPHPT